jgi:hypothetical protein
MTSKGKKNQEKNSQNLEQAHAKAIKQENYQ